MPRPKSTIAVVLIKGRGDDDALLAEIDKTEQSSIPVSDRMRDLAFKGLRYEQAIKEQRGDR